MPWVSAHVARSDAVALFNLPASTAIRRPAPRAATPCTAGDAAPVRTSERDRQNKMRQRSSRAQTAGGMRDAPSAATAMSATTSLCGFVVCLAVACSAGFAGLLAKRFCERCKFFGAKLAALATAVLLCSVGTSEALVLRWWWRGRLSKATLSRGAESVEAIQRIDGAATMPLPRSSHPSRWQSLVARDRIYRQTHRETMAMLRLIAAVAVVTALQAPIVKPPTTTKLRSTPTKTPATASTSR